MWFPVTEGLKCFVFMCPCKLSAKPTVICLLHDGHTDVFTPTNTLALMATPTCSHRPNTLALMATPTCSHRPIHLHWWPHIRVHTDQYTCPDCHTDVFTPTYTLALFATPTCSHRPTHLSCLPHRRVHTDLHTCPVGHTDVITSTKYTFRD